MRIEIVFINGVVICKVQSGERHQRVVLQALAADHLVLAWRPDLAMFADLAQEVADENRHLGEERALKSLILRIWDDGTKTA